MAFFHLLNTGIVPLKDDKLEKEMLKDVSHADVAKGEDSIDDTDATYDDYYDVRTFKIYFHVKFRF